MANGVYWVGSDGNVYAKSSAFEGVKNVGSLSQQQQFRSMGLPNFLDNYSQIDDPASASGAPSGGGGGGSADPNAAMASSLRSRIANSGAGIDAAYSALFGDLDTLLKSRGSELETQYGDQLKKAADDYSAALPQIETSYAAIGAGDSTDQTDAKGKAKTGFEDTTKTIQKNKADDQAKLGAYGNEQRAKFTADQEAARRAVESANGTTDPDALRGLANELDTNLSQTNVTRATLAPDSSARKALSDLTGDNGRFEAATNALDSILKSSMSGAVKAAAVKAITDAGGLSDQEKKKVQEQYGNAYAEQSAL